MLNREEMHDELFKFATANHCSAPKSAMTLGFAFEFAKHIAEMARKDALEEVTKIIKAQTETLPGYSMPLIDAGKLIKAIENIKETS